MRLFWLAGIVAVSLTLVGCGDDSGDDSGDAIPDGNGDDFDVDDFADDASSDEGRGTVTVGDTTYEFMLSGTSDNIDGTTYTGTCSNLMGVITGGGYVTDGRGISVEFEFPPVDEAEQAETGVDKAYIEIEIDKDGGFAADPDVGDGESGIDEWSIDDDTDTASGTATFIEIEPFGSPVEGAQPMDGSFEISCSE